MLLALMPIVWPDDAPVAPPPEAAPMLCGILLAPRRPKRPEQDETPAALYDCRVSGLR